MPKKGDLEHKTLQFIVSAGAEGLLQSELWHKVSASSREGSRISIKLENKGLIHRERELHDGRWTYRLFSKKRPVSLGSILTCPCLVCESNPRCEVGGSISPNDCERLTEWIMNVSLKETTPSSGEGYIAKSMG